jgi:phospholipid-binding lipoprotein MlaA
MFDFNIALDKAVMRPTAEFYNDVVPEKGRTGVHNVLANLNGPVVFANQLLQGKLQDAGDTLARTVLNSSVGVGGLVDVGARAGLPAQDTDFGITLGVWGVKEGPYLVLPLLGPAPPRDLVGSGADTFLDPVAYVDFRSKFYYVAGATALKVIDLRARNIATLDDIERTSIDYYASVRSLYLQNRQSKIGGDPIDTTPNDDF